VISDRPTAPSGRPDCAQEGVGVASELIHEIGRIRLTYPHHSNTREA